MHAFLPMMIKSKWSSTAVYLLMEQTKQQLDFRAEFKTGHICITTDVVGFRSIDRDHEIE